MGKSYKEVWNAYNEKKKSKISYADVYAKWEEEQAKQQVNNTVQLPTRNNTVNLPISQNVQVSQNIQKPTTNKYSRTQTNQSNKKQPNYGLGNIDLNNRPIVKNSDGTISTVRSMSFQDDNGKEVLIPTVINGKVVSDDEAINHYYKTGEYLGKFDSVEAADKYAIQLHKDQEKQYSNLPTKKSIQEIAAPVMENIEKKKEQQKFVNKSGLNQLAKYAEEYIREPEILKDNKRFLEDGYQFGDLTRTGVENFIDNYKVAGSTIAKGLGSIAKGGIRISEDAANLLAAGTAQVADSVFGQKEWADRIRKDIAKNPYQITPMIDALNEKTLIDKHNAIGSSGEEVLEGVGQTLGYMALAELNPAVSTGAMFASGAGGSLAESYQKENIKDYQAWMKALGSGAIETLSENLFGFFGKTGLDEALANKISKNLTSGLAKTLARSGVKASSEAAEEFISYTLGYGLDHLINWASNGKGADFNSKWDWNDVLKQMGNAALSTLGIDAATTVNNINQVKNENNLTTQAAINEYARRLDEPNKNVPIQQPPIDNQKNQEQNYKEDALKEINNARISNTEKAQMLDALNSMETVTEADIQAIRNTISEINKSNMLPTKENYKESQERRQKYTQYKNDTGNYDSSVVDNVLAGIPENRNGKRTVKQWLKAANEIGKLVANESNENIERIAYKSWFDLEPNKNITRYDKDTKSNAAFQKFTSDEWVNMINNAVNEARANNQMQETLPVVNQENTVVKESIDTNIPRNLVETAKKYNLNYKNTNLSEIQKSLENKGIETRFDDTEFSNENEGAKWKLTRDENGNVKREIILNPNANEKTVVQEMAIHELTHDIVAKNTKTSEKLYNEVKEWLSKDTQYQEQLDSLKDIYGENLAEEEAIAKTLQTKLGNQEEINRLVNYNPSTARKIYDWVIDKLNKMTGGRIEKLYWEDVKNKFERAYSEQGNYNKSSTKFSISQDGKMQENGKNVTLDAETGSSNKTLLAIHNLTEDKLKGILELGGFPVPSIAITNPNIVAHNEFGDISVIFNKETINPKSKKNEVYDRDVWSPTFPSIEYEANKTSIDNIKNSLNIFKNYQDLDSIQRRTNQELNKDQIERDLNNYGLEGLKDSFKNNKYLKYTYLKANNQIEPVMKQIKFNNDVSNETLQQFLDEYPNMADFTQNTPLNQLSVEQTEQLKDQIKNIIKPDLEKQYGKYGEDGQAVIDSILKKYDNFNKLNNFIYSANSMNREGNTATEINEDATFDRVNEILNQEKFNDWVDSVFTDNIIANKGFDNGKDIFTPQGNRRSFKATHNEINLENLVKAMSRKSTKGGQDVGIFGTGFGRISAQTANRFNSIKDIKSNESRLMTRDQATEVIQPLSEQLYSRVDELADFYTRKDYNSDMVNHMQGVDTISEIIEELAGGQLTEDRFRRILNEYNSFDVSNIPSDLLNNIIDDLKQIKRLPTDYFEAKPQRAVGFDEIDAIVIPSDLNTDLKQQLKDRGIKTIEYDRNNENEKSDIIKSLNDYKFSKTAQNFDEYIQNRVGKQGTRTTLEELKLPTPEKTIKDVGLPKTSGESINWNEIERPEGKFRKHYQSIIQSSNTTAEAKAIAKEMMGSDTYIPQSNKELLSKADARIGNTSPETELSSLLSKALNNEKVNDIDIAVGERLIEYYSKTGDSQKLLDAIHATAMAGTQAGRTVQAMAILNHMTPQGQVVWLQRSIDKANNQLQQKYKNKQEIPQFTLTEDMTNRLLQTDSKEELYDVLDDIYEELGEQVPKGLAEQIDEWRYFSMLANIKTHARNVIGNVAMGGVQRLKNKVAGAIEGAVAKVNPNIERTHTIRRASEEVKNFAKNDINNMDVQTELGMNENKYNPQSRLQNARKTFKSDTLNNTIGKMFDFNSKMLEVEDNIGLKAAYINSLSNYLTANNIDVKNISDAQLQKARLHAINEAQEATFHQASALATLLNQLGRKNNLGKFALDAIVPFKKTPINVAKTGIQYSPVGLVKSAVYDVAKVRNGSMTINKYIDNVSKGLTGTGITLMGYALAQAGILKASGDEDDKKETYDEEQGKQPYSLEIGGKSASLDWLSPVGIPLFIGAEISQQFNQTKKEKTSKSTDDNKLLNQIINRVGNMGTAFSNAIQPMSEMSMISGLTSVLSSYNKEAAAGNMFANSVKSYINQFVPTALSQVARTTDEYERTTKSTKSGILPRAIDTTVNQIKSKIPGLRQTLPTKTNIWGKDVEQSQNLPFRAFNNFINPAIVKDVSSDKVDKELNKLYANTKDSSIIPKSINKNFSQDGQEYVLTNKEYADYNKMYGETAYNLIKGLVNSSNYDKLTTKQKQKAIEEIYKYSNEKYKNDYMDKNKIKYDPSTLSSVVDKLDNVGKSNYFEYLAKTQGIDKRKEKLEVLSNASYSNKTKKIIYENSIGEDDDLYNNVMKKSNIDMTEYLKYKTQEFVSDKKDDGTIDGKSISGSKKKKVLNYINNMSSKVTYEQKLLLAGTQYKLSNAERAEVAKYVNSLNIKKDEKLDIYKKLQGFTVYKNGTIKF